MKRALLTGLVGVIGCARGGAVSAPSPTSPTPVAPPVAVAEPTPIATRCPADAAGPKVRLAGPPPACDDGRTACAAACSADDGVACLLLAINDEVGGDSVRARPSYWRACELGVLAGCTNVAAAMVFDAPDDPAVAICTTRTFALACAGDDAWGCVMHGRALMDGRGTPRDLAAAHAAVARACPLALDEAVCLRAHQLQAELDALAP